jgi:transcriptional regulator GlxA family with amidase domain
MNHYEDSPSALTGEIMWRAFEYYEPLKRLSLYVRQNPAECLGLEQAAAIAGFERTHFSSFFHHKTRVTFKYWNDLRRIERAALCLRESDGTITVVALECGFNDLRTFERTFRRIKGVTPRQYRRQHQPA